MAMLENSNNKRYLHKNKIYFPKENHSIVSLLQYGRREHTIVSLVSFLEGNFKVFHYNVVQ